MDIHRCVVVCGMGEGQSNHGESWGQAVFGSPSQRGPATPIGTSRMWLWFRDHTILKSFQGPWEEEVRSSSS